MIRRFISNMLKDMLRKEMKRKIFLASFAAILKGVTTYDRETFSKLDRVLLLSEQNEDALAVPVILSKAIWKGKESIEICGDNVFDGEFNQDRISNVVGNILSNMPSWLLYGDTEEIERDISVILTERKELLGA